MFCKNCGIGMMFVPFACSTHVNICLDAATYIDCWYNVNITSKRTVPEISESGPNASSYVFLHWTFHHSLSQPIFIDMVAERTSGPCDREPIVPSLLPESHSWAGTISFKIPCCCIGQLLNLQMSVVADRLQTG